VPLQFYQCLCYLLGSGRGVNSRSADTLFCNDSLIIVACLMMVIAPQEEKQSSSAWRIQFAALCQNSEKNDNINQQRHPLSLVSRTEELLGRNSSDTGLENREYGRGDRLPWRRDTLKRIFNWI
jgi:hypothetical protein